MNTEIEIPKLYRTETLEINGNKVEIKGYRGNDYIQARVLERQMIKINKLQMKLTKLSSDRLKENEAQGNEEKEVKETKDEEEEEEIKINWKDNDIENLATLNEQMLDIRNDIEDIIYKLAQRGLKRFYYPGLSTKEIDNLEDIEVDEVTITEVHKAMARLSNIPGKKAKKEEKPDKKTGKGRQPSKKTSKTSAN